MHGTVAAATQHTWLLLQWLMTDANSPIHDFYPTDFRVDLEGKRNDWEGVVLIPFIDQARLLAASHTVGPAKLLRVSMLLCSALH